MKKLLDVKKIIKRAKICLDLKTDTELANLLGVKQSTVSAWKRRGNIDLNKIITLCKNKGVSMDWLIYGEKTECPVCSEKSHDVESKIMEMLESMTEEQRRDVLKYVEKEKLFDELIKNRKTA